LIEVEYCGSRERGRKEVERSLITYEIGGQPLGLKAKRDPSCAAVLDRYSIHLYLSSESEVAENTRSGGAVKEYACVPPI
jgi:hypothetical protein